MKRAFPLSGLLTMIVVVSAQSYGQGRTNMIGGGGGWGPGSICNRLFDLKTIGTFTGQVVIVDKIKPMRGMSDGVHLVLKTSSGLISVHMGPAWYLEEQEMKIEAKDRIQVKCSKVTFQGTSAIIAQEIKRGEDTLTLRDANGFPRWSGRRGR